MPRSIVRPLTKGMRRLLYVASVLVLLAAAELYVLTDHTERFFAWTIAPGLTAAFLGAGYLSAFFLELLSARRREWARARIAVPAVLAFTVLTLIATVAHRDRFHFASPHPVAWFSAWAWLGIYTFVPVTMVVLLVGQLRAPGEDAPRRAPFPGWGRAILAVQGVVLLVLGAALLVAPERTASLWPWALTPLTGRAVGAWLAGVGVGLLHALVENDLDRVTPAGAVTYAMFGLFELVALARYSTDVDWGKARAWVYLGFLLSVVTVGVLGLLASRATRRSGSGGQGPSA